MSDLRTPQSFDGLPDLGGSHDPQEPVGTHSFDEPQRPSPIFVIVRTLRLFVTLIFPVSLAIIMPALGAGAMIEWWAWVALLVFAAIATALTIFWTWISWKRFTFQLSDTELRIDQGVIFRQASHIPFDRIHSVDHSAGVIERVLGVVKLSVQTAGSSAKAEGIIEGLTLDVAEALQRELFRRARGGSVAHTPVPAGALAPEGSPIRPDIAASLSDISAQVRGVLGGMDVDAPVTFEYKLPTKNLILAGISSTQSFLAVFILIAAGAQFLEMFRLFEQAGDVVSRLPVTAALVITLIVLVFTWLVSVVSTTLKFGGFTVRRRGPRVEVDRGLLERKVAGIPVERIQSVRIDSGIIRRFLKYAEIELDTAGGLGKSDSSADVPVNIVHPFIETADVRGFLERIVPEIDDVPDATERLPRRVLRRYLFRWFLAAVPVAVLPALVWWLASEYVAVALAVAVVIVALFLVLGWQSYLSRGWATSDRTLVVTGGITSRTTMIVPKRRIQWARVSQTPFQRIAGLATLTVTTAATPRASVRDLPVDTAQEIQRWALPGETRVVSSPSTSAKGI